MSRNAAFDDLAGQYDRYRPRYPASLADAAIGDRRSDLTLVDAGAGTGISLEWGMRTCATSGFMRSTSPRAWWTRAGASFPMPRGT